jgi:hypothetical protein
VPTTADSPGCLCRPCAHVHLWCVLTCLRFVCGLSALCCACAVDGRGRSLPSPCSGSCSLPPPRSPLVLKCASFIAGVCGSAFVVAPTPTLAAPTPSHPTPCPHPVALVLTVC